jgi:lipopolysaccharide transport system ATP-binding protein
MDQGRIVQSGTPAEVTDAYLTAVRKEDNAALLQRFRSLVGARRGERGEEIRELGIYESGSDIARNLLECGRDAVIRAVVKRACANTQLSVRIERLDGLVVIDETRLLDALLGSGAEDTSLAIELAMRPLVLGPGIYRMRAQLLADGKAAADRHTVFEVFSRHPPTGGRPALIYPASIAVSRVSDIGSDGCAGKEPVDGRGARIHAGRHSSRTELSLDHDSGSLPRLAPG